MPTTTTAAPPTSANEGTPRPRTTEVTRAPIGIIPANSPARSGPRWGSALYQRKNATAVTTTAW